MGTPTASVSVDGAGSVGLAFFIFDRSALQKESDRIEDAVKYYYPKEDFRLENVKEKCRQLVGMSDCMANITGIRPQLFRLKKEKYVMKQEQDYGIALAGRLSDSDSFLVDKLDRLYDMFVFYHGSLRHVYQQMEGDNQCFIDRLDFIWSRYYQHTDEKQVQNQDFMLTIFHPLPYVDLPKASCQSFIKASQLLQTCQRQKGVLAGCIIYQEDILYTQLSPALTEKLLVCAGRAPVERASTAKRTGFPLPEFIQLYSLYLTKDEYRQLLPSSSDNAQELIIPPIAGDSESSLQPLYASQLSREERARTASASSVGSSSLSPSVLSRLSRIGSRSISPEKQKKHNFCAVQPVALPFSNRQQQTSNSLQSNLMDNNEQVMNVRGHSEELRRNAVAPQHNLQTPAGKELSLTVFTSEGKFGAVNGGEDNDKCASSQSNIVVLSPHCQSLVSSKKAVTVENISNQARIGTEELDEFDSTSSNCFVNSVSSLSNTQQALPDSAKANAHETYKKRLSAPNMLQTTTADSSMLSSSLQSPSDFSVSCIDANLLSAGSSYGSIVSTEEHGEHVEVIRARSTDSGDSDSIYLDCRPGQDSSSSPSPQFAAVQTESSSSSQLHEKISTLEKRVNPIIRKTEETRATKQSDIVEIAPAGAAKQDEMTEGVASLEMSDLVDLPYRRQSAFSECSYTASPFSELVADGVNLEDIEEDGDEDVLDMVSATLYIQAPEHSNLMLLLVAEKHLEKDKETVQCLWEHSLVLLADLAVSLKEPVSHLSSSRSVTSFYYTAYNSYEKTMSTNCKQGISQNAQKFGRVIKTMQKQHNLNPDITDIVLRYPVLCSAYARFSLGKEIYFQPRGGHSYRLIAPPGTPDMRDNAPTKEAVGFNIEISARKKLSSEAGINLI